MPPRLQHRRTPTPEPPSPTIARPDHLPSDSWPTSHPQYSEDIHKLSCSINFLALRSKCSQLRNGVRCIISPKYYVGSNNLVREIIFQDQVVWIVLFARLDSEGSFAAQASVMKSLRGSIAVPEVFSDSDQADELGGRYLLIEGICGFRAEAEYLMFGIPDRYWNHVLEQLAHIMAAGMAITWSTFKVGDQEYRSDTEFWIDESRQNICDALREIRKSGSLIDESDYLDFLGYNTEFLSVLFDELLYLCSEFLREDRRPPNVLMNFPSALPPLKMENILFDSDYNIKGLIGFPRAESVSSWDYFQYPFGLDEIFEDPSMRRTTTWMREYFVDAWKQRMEAQGMDWGGDLQDREQWCQKEKVAVFYQFRESEEPTEEILQLLLTCGYSFDEQMPVEQLYNAFIAVALSTYKLESAAWRCRPDFWTDMFFDVLESPELGQLADEGRVFQNRNVDRGKLADVMAILY
jgi:hypothetical protein